MTASSAFAPALDCLDLMIHREILRLRARYAMSTDELRGLYVSDEQVDALLGCDKTQPRFGPLVDQISARLPVAVATLANHGRWGNMVRQLRLDPFDELVLFCAFAPHLDDKYLPLFAYLNDDVSQRHLTQGLVLRLMQLVPDDQRRWALSCGGHLWQHGLLEAVPEQQTSALRINDGVATYLLGAPLDHCLASAAISVMSASDCKDANLPVPELVQSALSNAGDHFGSRVVGMVGPARSGRRTFARHALASQVQTIVEVELGRLDVGANARLHFRRIVLHARIANCGVILRGAPTPEMIPVLRQCLADTAAINVPIIVAVETRKDLLALCPGAIAVEVPDLGVADRKRVWDYRLGQCRLRAEEQAVWDTADLFALPFQTIGNAVDALAADVGEDRKVSGAQLRAAARSRSSDAFGTGAEQVKDDYDINDLILPNVVRDRINDFIAATRNRRIVYETWGMQRRLGPARGLAAMFTGASGTGKSMAASVIGKALGLDLYRIELSAMVSKYIGETEKNLDAVFNAAQAANAILFFDEADALFGKRSEVKDAHDRYANIECAYLLQKMERHDGLVILTTNMPRGLDTAFSRRIQFVIDFPRPDADLRERLWKGMFPSQVPLAPDVDFAFLARNFENTGGEIRNIALDAALRTASQPGASVTMQSLLKAVERQMVKQGRAPTAAAFKQHFMLVKQTAT